MVTNLLIRNNYIRINLKMFIISYFKTRIATNYFYIKNQDTYLVKSLSPSNVSLPGSRKTSEEAQEETPPGRTSNLFFYLRLHPTGLNSLKNQLSNYLFILIIIDQLMPVLYTPKGVKMLSFYKIFFL